MTINIKEGVFEVNTSESYNKDIFLYENNIIIPYINIEIFDINFASHIIKRYDKLDFSYLIFKDVKEISWNFEFNDEIKYTKLIFDNFLYKNDYLIDCIEATNIFTEHYGYNIVIKFKEQFLYFSENVGVKNKALNFWIPINTSNFQRNMDDRKVHFFFTKKSIPDEVLKLVGIKDVTMLKTLDILKFDD